MTADFDAVVDDIDGDDEPLLIRLGAQALWKRGWTGAGIHVAILDTGLTDSVAPCIRHLHGGLAFASDATPPPKPRPPQLKKTSKIRDKEATVDQVEMKVTSRPVHAYRHIPLPPLQPSPIGRRPAWMRFGWQPPLITDPVGHGSLVAGIVAAHCPWQCRGVAPDAGLWILRVYSAKQTSYTSWFLDALNYALFRRVHIVNFSLGGMDYRDQPFVDKIRELSANGIIVVAAMGNDGPVHGSASHPASQLDTLAVGGVARSSSAAFDSARDQSDGYRIPKFASRGMALDRLPYPGHFLPDVVTYAEHVSAPSPDGSHCDIRDGTSFSTPLVSGVVALLLNGLQVHYPNSRLHTNIAAIKQLLMSTAQFLPGIPILQQGAGMVDPVAAMDSLRHFQPSLWLFPAALWLDQCPDFEPYCLQPLVPQAMPVWTTVAVYNPLAMQSQIRHRPTVHLANCQGFVGQEAFECPTSLTVDVEFRYSDSFFPWAGTLMLGWTLKSAEGVDHLSNDRASVQGSINIIVEHQDAHSIAVEQTASLPFSFALQQTPARHRRILWDQFHSLHYPLEFYPSDDFVSSEQKMDSGGDHPFTNFYVLYKSLLELGYHMDILTEPWTCFDASLYGTLLIVDPEAKVTVSEREKLWRDVEQYGLNVLILGEWDDEKMRDKLAFFDDSTQNWRSPVTGGMNLRQINSLLRRWCLGFRPGSVSGTLQLRDRMRPSKRLAVDIRSASTVWANNELLFLAAEVKPDQPSFVTNRTIKQESSTVMPVAVLKDVNGALHDGGRIVLVGDSSFVDEISWKAASRKSGAADATYLGGSLDGITFLHLLLDYSSSGKISNLLQTTLDFDPAWKSLPDVVPLNSSGISIPSQWACGEYPNFSGDLAEPQSTISSDMDADETLLADLSEHSNANFNDLAYEPFSGADSEYASISNDFSELWWIPLLVLLAYGWFKLRNNSSFRIKPDRFRR